MDASEINRSLVSELEAMGFSVAQATKALCSSGNSSLEAAVNWIIDHEDEAYIDEMPMVPVDIIETSTPTFDSEQAKLKAQELRFDFMLKFHEEDSCFIQKLETVIGRSEHTRGEKRQEKNWKKKGRRKGYAQAKNGLQLSEWQRKMRGNDLKHRGRPKKMRREGQGKEFAKSFSRTWQKGRLGLVRL